MKKKRGGLVLLMIVGVWAMVTAYFAYQHTFVIPTCYLEERITLDNRQYILQEIDAVNFEKVFPDNFNYWPLNVLEKLPVSLRLPYWEVINFYALPRIAYNGAWEINIKGMAIPSLEPTSENPDIYVDGHYHGRAVQQPDNEDFSFFNTRGKYYSAEEVDQPITLIFEDKNTGHKAEITLQPQWINKHYFMELPQEMAADPADMVSHFLALAAQGNKSEALKLVTAEKRNEFIWPPAMEIMNQLNLEGNLSYSLERQENQGKYPVIYALTIRETEATAPLTVNMVKNQDNYEIIEIM